jgi:hypothetical protein
MKRSLKQLQEDAQAQQEDDLLRAQIEREELAEAAEARKNSKENAFSDKWRGYLEKWEEHGLRIASNQECDCHVLLCQVRSPLSLTLFT